MPTERRGGWLYFSEEMRDAIEPEAVGVMVTDWIEKKRFAMFTHAHDAKRFRTWRLDIEKSLSDVIAASPKPPRFP